MYIEIDSFLTVGMNTSTPHGPTMRKDYGFSIRIRLWKKEKKTHSPQSVKRKKKNESSSKSQLCNPKYEKWFWNTVIYDLWKQTIYLYEFNKVNWFLNELLCSEIHHEVDTLFQQDVY